MEAIIGSDGSTDAVATAAARAAEGISLLEDLYGSEEYKGHLAVVFAQRALALAISRA
jgi:carbon-monoxide dehydrogenase medium subunit